MSKKTLAMVITALLLTTLLTPCLAEEVYGTFDCQSFESGDVATNGGIFMDGWRTSFNVSVSTEEKLSGERSLKIENRGEEKEFIYRDTQVVPGKTYVFSTWVKIDGTLTLYPGKSAAYVQIGVGSPEWLSYGDCPNIANTTDDQWVMLKKEFTATETTARLVFRVFQASAGTVYFDDASLILKDEKGIYVNGGFEDVITNKNGDTEYLWPTGWDFGGYYSTPGKDLKISETAGRTGNGLEMIYAGDTGQKIAVYDITDKLTVGKWYSLSAWYWRSQAYQSAAYTGIYITTVTNSATTAGTVIASDRTSWFVESWREFKTPYFQFTEEMKKSGQHYYVMLHTGRVDETMYVYWDDVELNELETKISFCQDDVEVEKLTAGKDVTAKLTYLNGTAKTQAPRLVLARYERLSDNKERLAEVSVQTSAEVLSGNYTDSVSATVSVPNDGGTYFVKAFVFDGATKTIIPLEDPVVLN